MFRHHPAVLFSLSIIFHLCTLRAHGENPTRPDAENLGDLSVEQLLNLTVTSPSRREEKISQAAAAITVLTQEDIRRSGATSIPEALRLVPGLDVARVDSHTWAISSRGFNDVFANKLLVLIDGRTVYTPLFSGVFWDVQDTMLEDIDRIEVIRGPGATQWGANAVNGVINIITKKAADTQGLLVTAGGGSFEHAFTGARFGGQLGDQIHYRVYGKWFDRGDSAPVSGSRADDDWDAARGGFRIDWNAPAGNLLTLQGDIYKAYEDELYRRLMPESPFSLRNEFHEDRVSGGNILGRWTHDFSDGSEFVFQTYFDRTHRDSSIVGDNLNTFDIDAQHRFSIGSRQTIIAGAGFRLLADDLRSTFDLGFDPGQRTTHLYSAFLQDEITLAPKQLVLTLGSKLEHNDYTGFELQPSARLLWTPTEKQSAWISISRAVRTPSRAEEDITLRQQPVYPRGALFRGLPPFVQPSPAAVTEVEGNNDFDSEKLIAYEAGYRCEIRDWLSLDTALFYNQYDDLRSVEPQNPVFDLGGFPPHVALRASNDLKGENYGGEIAASAQVTPQWRLNAGYSLLFSKLHRKDGGTDTTTELFMEGSSPQNQFFLRSSLDLPHGFEFDGTLRYVDSLSAGSVPGYLTLDLRLGWHVTRNLELSVVGQNLLDWRHREFTPTTIATGSTQVESGIYGKATIHF